ncbi:MAG: tetraacyldisaccharide 4'-kinase [Myxococcota bacterium]
MWDLLTLPALPAAMALAAIHPRLRADLAERLGVAVAPVQPGSIWIHGASVGEMRVVEGLLSSLPRPVLITTDTDTGRRTAARLALRFSGVYASACPLDHLLALAPLWAEARPRLLCFVEGTFWPGLARRAAKAGIPVWRVSAKASARTRAVPHGLLQRLWAPTTTVWARDADAAAFFRTLHDDVRLLGNPKAWVPPPPGGLRLPRPTVVGASTRDGDEGRIVDAVAALESRPLVYLAVRHLHRVDQVETDLRSRGLRVVRRSACTPEALKAAEVILGDRHGMLAADLAFATVAIIGGTFDPRIGGHSPFEAAAAGIPVIAGPHTHAQGEAFDSVGAHRVTEQSLPATLQTLLRANSSPVRESAGPPAAWRQALSTLGPPAPEASPRPWAWPLVPLVALGGRLRRRGAHRNSDVPTIVVGSANARSPGRTSLVRALVQELRNRGHRVGVVLRGYRRPSRGLVVSDDPSNHAGLGDEGVIHARAGALVAAGADRARGVAALIARGASVILSDDGLFRADLVPSLRVEVVDARFPGARGPLPVGERRSGRHPTDAPTIRIATHVSSHFPAPGGTVPLKRIPGPWVPAPPKGPLVAFAGIGRPVDFFDSLSDMKVVDAVALPDHAPIHEARWRMLLERAKGCTLVTTGKDAARLSKERLRQVVWRDLDVVVPDELRRRLPEAPR